MKRFPLTLAAIVCGMAMHAQQNLMGTAFLKLLISGRFSEKRPESFCFFTKFISLQKKVKAFTIYSHTIVPKPIND